MEEKQGYTGLGRLQEKRVHRTASQRITRQKRNEVKRSAHCHRLVGLEIRLTEAKKRREPPSIERFREIEGIKSEIREEWKKLRPATGQTAFSRFQQEEVMSKQFFRRFKSKNANGNIGELNVVPDWDDPEAMREPTQADGGIAQEATKYYKWLYQRKDTSQRVV